MKNKIVIIGILLIVLATSLIFNGLLLIKKESSYIQITGEKVDTTNNSYECMIKNEFTNKDFSQIETHNIVFDKFGTVLKIIVKYQWKYNNVEQYENDITVYKNSEKRKYVFDDKNKTIICTYENDYTTTNDTDEKKDLWIKNIINSYNKNGHTCNLK